MLLSTKKKLLQLILQAMQEVVAAQAMQSCRLSSGKVSIFWALLREITQKRLSIFPINC